jgi:hypothetical protein
MKRNIIIIGAGVAAVLGLGVWFYINEFSVELPEYPIAEKSVWLEQNWSAEQRNWFHHADQGTITFGIPYEWFTSLEQPALFLGTPGLLTDPVYLDRFGFISDNEGSASHGLPVGFGQGRSIKRRDGTAWYNPETKLNMTAMGLTCAACHTGRLTYKKNEVFIDGAPAIIRVDQFQTAIALALVYARYVPFRFGRFADRILGSNPSGDAKAALRAQLDEVLEQYKKVKALDNAVKKQSVEEGFARLDALNRIGNTVFSLDLDADRNYAAKSAPVHFPRIWNSSWFTWVQYNGSIEQPMVRNAGEALGVFADVSLTVEKSNLYQSSIQLDALYKIEQLLAGKPPNAREGFTGLNSPKWPENILPPIDEGLAAKGASLYKATCQECHLPPVTAPEFWSSSRWTPPNELGERFLDVEMIPLQYIGTDPAQAEGMRNRKVSIPGNLGINTNEFGPALGQLVENTANYWYDHQNPPVLESERRKMNGNRPNGIQAPLAYKVRPLNGIWATPPYLHNGSVPNVYALLSPVAERPAKFFLGNREYDPVNLGYHTEQVPGSFELDTSIKGNLNTGHEFDDDPKKPGVVGRRLSPGERRALVEYLKTL